MTVAGGSKNRVITIPHPDGHEEEIQKSLNEFKTAGTKKEESPYNRTYTPPGASTPADGYTYSTRKTPIVAFKQHGISLSQTGLSVMSYSGYGNRLSPKWWDEDYSGIKTARCEHGKSHSIPHPGCGCGWWGTINPSDAQANGYHRQGQLLFRVKFFGVIEERDNGYRAQFMEVDKIFGPPHCIFCKSQRYNMVIKRDSIFNTQSGPGELIPLCDSHGPSEKATSFVRLSQDDITDILGIEYLSGENIPESQRK